MKDRATRTRHVHQHWQTSPNGRVRCGLPDCHEVFATVCPDHQANGFAAAPCATCGGSGLLPYTPPPPEGEPESEWAKAVRQVEVVITAVAAMQRLQRRMAS